MPKLEVPPGFAKEVADRIGCKTDMAVPFIEIALQNAILFDGKQSDYGPANISGFGTFGCIVRANDKFERLKNLFNKRRKRAVNEPIKDSYRDISNYMNIALLIEEGSWPGLPLK